MPTPQSGPFLLSLPFAGTWQLLPPPLDAELLLCSGKSCARAAGLGLDSSLSMPGWTFGCDTHWRGWTRMSSCNAET